MKYHVRLSMRGYQALSSGAHGYLMEDHNLEIRHEHSLLAARLCCILLCMKIMHKCKGCYIVK